VGARAADDRDGDIARDLDAMLGQRPRCRSTMRMAGDPYAAAMGKRTVYLRELKPASLDPFTVADIAD
jgi:hypothetical protein